jgi:hypothetical protein
MNQLRVVQSAWAGTILALSTWAVLVRTDRVGFEISAVISLVHLVAALATFRNLRVGWVACLFLSMLAFWFFGLAMAVSLSMYLVGTIKFGDAWTIWAILGTFLVFMVAPAALSLWLFWTHRGVLLEQFGIRGKYAS